MTKGELFLDTMRFHARHGVMPNEQLVGGEYSVSLRISYDFHQAQITDEISDAIDYGKVYELVKKEMAQPSKLIENVARRIQDTLLENFPQIERLHTAVSKFHPPFEGEMNRAVVELIWEKEIK